MKKLSIVYYGEDREVAFKSDLEIMEGFIKEIGRNYPI